MKTKVLVTGANGQLAKTFNHLFSNNSEGILFDFFTKEDLDITSAEAVKQIFKDNNYNYCINCAAYTNVEKAETDRELAFLINAKGAENIAFSCKRNSVKLIHISTDYVFDGLKKTPYIVEDLVNPINEYGKSKLQGEKNIQEILDEHYIIRASWLYSIFGKNFLKTIVNKVKENAELKITTSQIGTPTSCEDLSNFIYFTLKENLPFGIYHFSAQGSATWFDFAKQISENFNDYKPTKLKPVTNYVTEAKRPGYSVLDISKTEKLYKVLDNWEESVNRTISQLN